MVSWCLFKKEIKTVFWIWSWIRIRNRNSYPDPTSKRKRIQNPLPQKNLSGSIWSSVELRGTGTVHNKFSVKFKTLQARCWTVPGYDIKKLLFRFPCELFQKDDWVAAKFQGVPFWAYYDGGMSCDRRGRPGAWWRPPGGWDRGLAALSGWTGPLHSTHTHSSCTVQPTNWSHEDFSHAVPSVQHLGF